MHCKTCVASCRRKARPIPPCWKIPKLKQSVLDKLIITHLLNTEVNRAKFILSDEQLGKYITQLPEFQQDGHFSQEVYDKLLSQNRLVTFSV